jgi:hypothetical protein
MKVLSGIISPIVRLLTKAFPAMAGDVGREQLQK